MPARIVMLPQLSHAGASDWNSANCSLRAVVGPASLGMHAGAGQEGRTDFRVAVVAVRVTVAIAVGVAIRVAFLGAGDWGLGARVAVAPLSLGLAVSVLVPLFSATGGRGFVDFP